MQNLFCLKVQNSSSVGGDGLFPLRIEQICSQFILQLFDDPAERGLSDINFFSGRRKCAAIDDLYKIFQLFYLHGDLRSHAFGLEKLP